VSSCNFFIDIISDHSPHNPRCQMSSISSTWSDGCSTTIFSNTNIFTFLPDAENPAAIGDLEEKGTSSETTNHQHMVSSISR
jgi:hypothetical protein